MADITPEIDAEFWRGVHALEFIETPAGDFAIPKYTKRGTRRIQQYKWASCSVDVQVYGKQYIKVGDCARLGAYTKLGRHVFLTPPTDKDAPQYKELVRAYIRGVLASYATDAYAYADIESRSFKIDVSVEDADRVFDIGRNALYNFIADNVAAPYTRNGNVVTWRNWNYIDLVGELTQDRERFPEEHYPGELKNAGEMTCMRVREGAPLPFKVRSSDSGYDLSLMVKIKEEDGIHYYGTGIAVTPPVGIYYEIVGRSSIAKSGYIVANGFGVIDATYTGELIVALRKMNPNAAELKLPRSLVQMLPRQYIQTPVRLVESLTASSRADTGGVSTASVGK